MTSSSYLLALNRAALVFFPDQPVSSGPLTEPHVVQVMIKQSRDFTVHDIQTFYRAQEDITKAIESILLAHITSPLPSKTVKVQGVDYYLSGERKEWFYGRSLKLTWGKQDIRTSEEKWTFVFNPNPVKS